MKLLLGFCAVSALLLAQPADAQDARSSLPAFSRPAASQSDNRVASIAAAATDENPNAGAEGQSSPPQVSESVFAVSGNCVWADNRRPEGAALGAALVTQIVTQAVKSFATALTNAANGQTRQSVATLIIDAAHDNCIQFVRGAIDVTADDQTVLRALSAYGISLEQAQQLRANGVRISTEPGLLVEARLHTMRLADSNRLVVLEPSFIGYSDPSFRQIFRGNERTIALQLQVAQAPAAPGDAAAGGQIMLGRRTPHSHQALWFSLSQPRDRQIASPGASLAFQLDDRNLYNARVSVAESTSPSAFLQFWATVASAPDVQSAAVSAATPHGAAH
jgi:hypothetical protein